jgi:hypothetical protein
MAKYERGRHRSLEQRMESKSGPQATAKASIPHKKDRSPVTQMFTGLVICRTQKAAESRRMRCP